MRQEVVSFCELGTLPGEARAVPEKIRQYEKHFRAITLPVSDEEARALVRMFGNDGCFGLASSLIALIETSPNWPLADCLTDSSNQYVNELRQRAIRGGYDL
jgi:hypothetical protein